MKQTLNHLYPKLRVHSWGGFGSQLFTALLILKLQERFPGRRINVIVHTSGVSRRVSEFNFEYLGTDFKQVEDYRSSNALVGSRRPYIEFIYYIFSEVKKIAVLILSGLQIIIKANNDKSFDSIKPWTLSLRGHYTNLALDKDLIASLYKTVFGFNSAKPKLDSYLAVHYRIGDLLHVKESSLVDPARIGKVVRGRKLDTSQQIIFSDSSTEDLVKFVKGFKTFSKFNYFHSDPKETLYLCIHAKVFIGTGAKLSLWAAIFRFFLYGAESSLPSELIWAREIGLESHWY